jgi:uncharacterized protein YggE
MKRIAWSVFAVLVFVLAAKGQTPDVKFIADTLVVQAEGNYETDPDLATLTFDISSQDKELKPTYERASEAMQKIVKLAERNGLKNEDVSVGVLKVTPYYTGDRRKRPKSFLVQGQLVLKIRDFSSLGPIMEESVTDDITDLRSLTYSLSDEEAAKQRAVSEAMRRAVGRASAALEQKGQKLGALRFASLDVRQLVGVAQLNYLETTAQYVTVNTETSELSRSSRAVQPPPPLPQPERITVSATVQCAFAIQ